MQNALISAEDLHRIMHDPGVVILDASYGLPPSNARIGKAMNFDIDAVADPAAPLPHTLPAPEIFAAAVGRMGIDNDTRVIVYDRAGMAMSAARVWWMFRVFGHDKVQVLDGGLPAWVAENFPLEPLCADAPAPAVFTPRFRPALFRRQEDLLANISARTETVLDARDARRYSGEMPERPGVDAGHIPGSLSLPYMQLIDPATGRLQSPEALTETFRHLDTQKPVVVSCGSGVTACVVALGLYQLGHKDAAIYGGSWTEWGGNPSLPKNKGNQP